jgi:hypothetical protein
MTTSVPAFRVVALVVAIVLVVTFATPARAEADVLAAIAIGTLVVAGIILLAYLVIANTADRNHADAGRIVYVACADDRCAGMAAASPGRDRVTALAPAPAFAPQSQ